MKATRWFEKNEAERTGGSGTQGRKKKKTKARDEGKQPRERERETRHRISERIEKENKNPRYSQLLISIINTWRGTRY